MKPFVHSTFYLGLILGVGQIALAANGGPGPSFQVDSSWPGQLPNKWAMGQVSGLAITGHDHILVIHRPRSIKGDQKTGAECCVPAPAVIEFAPNGKVVRAWGGPGTGYEWPQSEHGIYADGKGNVWVSGVAGKDFGRILKFTSDGKFLMQIGENLPAGQTFDINSTTVLGRQPADMYVD